MAEVTAQTAYDQLKAAADAGFTAQAAVNKQTIRSVTAVPGGVEVTKGDGSKSTVNVSGGAATFTAHWDHLNLRWMTGATQFDAAGNPTNGTQVTAANHPDWAGFAARTFWALSAVTSDELGDLTWLESAGAVPAEIKLSADLAV